MTKSLCNTQLAVLFDNCSDAIFLLDKNGTIINYNQAAKPLIGDSNEARIQTLLATQKTINLTNTAGEEHHYDVKIINLPDSSENQIHSAYILYDITRQQELTSEKNSLAEQLVTERITDPGTKLLNQRGLLLALEPQISRCRRYGNTVSVICIDICGDGVRADLVVSISQMLKDQLRWADLVSHIENDVFLLALPETGINESHRLTQKIDEHIKQLIDTKKAGDNQQTWSFYGVAEWRKSDNASTLIKRALANMEYEKLEKNGRVLAS